MDTFTRSWDFDNNWICPPAHLVPRTLRHMRSCCAQGTLIVPLWRSAPFWPLLTTDGSHLAHFVEDWVDLPPLKTTFCMGRHSSGVFGRENLNFRVLAVRINFRSARYFITGFCASDQGWYSQCSPAYFGKCFIFGGYLFNFLLILFSVSWWHRMVWGQWVAFR